MLCLLSYQIFFLIAYTQCIDVCSIIFCLVRTMNVNELLCYVAYGAADNSPSTFSTRM